MGTRVAALVLLTSASVACGGVAPEPREDTEPVRRYGISVEPPAGWHVRLTRGTVEAATVPVASLAPQPVLGDADVVVRLFEFEPDLESELYREAELARTYSDGGPRPFDAAEFSLPEWGGDNPGAHGFARRNFRLAGRYFDLFVETGRLTPPAEAVAGLNGLLASLQVRPGEFYPGTVAAPRFAATQGWYLSSAADRPVRASDYAEAWASTVPYRNGPRDLPPQSTLETLPPDGILIWVGLARDNRYPPTSELRRHLPRIDVPLQLAQMHGGPGWEGQIRDLSLYRLHGLVPDRYHVDVWVFFGRGEPTSAQRTRAQEMLDRLELPDWGGWELDGRSDPIEA